MFHVTEYGEYVSSSEGKDNHKSHKGAKTAKGKGKHASSKFKNKIKSVIRENRVVDRFAFPPETILQFRICLRVITAILAYDRRITLPCIDTVFTYLSLPTLGKLITPKNPQHRPYISYDHIFRRVIGLLRVEHKACGNPLKALTSDDILVLVDVAYHTLTPEEKKNCPTTKEWHRIALHNMNALHDPENAFFTLVVYTGVEIHG